MSGERAGRSKVPGSEPPPPLATRLYTLVSVAPAAAARFHVLLDGKVVRTPRQHELWLPTRALADAVAAEWEVQGERIDPSTMPLTRLANTVVDGVCGRRTAVGDDVVRYAGSDLLCYRAEGPAALVSREAVRWDPLLTWARAALCARLEVSEGVMPVRQSDAALDGIRAEMARLDPFRLAAVHTMTTLTGSCVLALAVLRQRITAEEAWAAAHVDEDWQTEQWGGDREAAARRVRRWEEMKAAERLLHLVNAG